MKRRALVAYSATSTHVQTTLDYINAFAKYSGFETHYVHSTHGMQVDINFEQYDVVFHNYCSRLCFEGYVSQSYRDRLRAFSGVKILAVQDEYDHTDVLKAAIKDLGFDIVLTCVPQDSLEYVYPRAEFPGVQFVTVFTGYVSDDFAAGRPAPTPLAERPVLIGYRGRDIGGRYGRLGFDKFEIGRRMKDICDARGIATDIAMDEASRIYGPAWFDFLDRCRAMLGSESGSNVFDFDGSIARTFKELTDANGGVAPSYQAFLPIVAERDGQIDMGQISPRVFECALMRTPMVLFAGRYSDAIEPDEHYIALSKDFSNVDEVLARLDDIQALEAMTERAYEHLVGSGKFNYRTFFGMVADCARAHPKFAARAAADVAAAVRADAPSFVIRDLAAVEHASLRPDGEADFRARIALDEIRLLESEDRRLTNYFAETREIFVAALDTQGRACEATYDRIAMGMGRYADHLPDIEELLSDSPFDRFLADTDREDAQWRQTWDNIAARLAAFSDGGPREQRNAVIAEALAAHRARYASLAGRFEPLNATYTAQVAKIGALAADSGAALQGALRAAWAAGQLSPALLLIAARLSARSAIGAAVRAPRNLAARALRSTAASPRVRSVALSLVERFPGLAQRSRRLAGWLKTHR